MPATLRNVLAAMLLAAGNGLCAAAAPDTLPGFSPEDLVMMNRLSDPQGSPDGRYIAFTLRSTDLAANRGNSDLYLLDLSVAGAAPRRLTQDPAADYNPRWSADGRYLYFLSTRSGSAQVWRLALEGGEAQPVTAYAVGIGALKVSPTEPRLLLSLDVMPDCATLACTAGRLAARAADKATGMAFDQLFVRHWDRWEDGTVAHLFTARVGADGRAGEPVDLMPGMRANAPSRPMGGDEEFTFSPDGRSVVFAAREAGRGEPWSTNFDLWQVDAAGGTPVNLTADNPAWDTQPRFLADGSLVYLAMRRPGFEADRFRVMLRDARGTRELAAGWDRSVGQIEVAHDGRNLLVTADDQGQTGLYRIDPRSGEVRPLRVQDQVAGFADTRRGTVIALASLAAPPDLFLLAPGAREPQRLTGVNAGVLAQRASTPFESFTFTGAGGATVRGHIVKPAGMVEGRKYPLAFIIHGGPQSAFGNAWSYRWNPKTFAGAGYAVVFIDFHGTPGYGQAFTDSISRDWGGAPLEDLKAGLDAAVKRYGFLDGDRACALGASYGGFMINWIAGHWPERFSCLVNHAGIFDSRSMYYSTEELWFPEWENGGPYFGTPASYEQFNPAAAVERWRTPMLVTHGQRDYRVPYSQGIATFTALQRRGVESRLVIFPDETHWIQSPANSLQWYHEVLGWLDRYLKPGAPASGPSDRATAAAQ
ncbi:MAG: S9 family peptidase [Steroidobacteraceae bacterium]